jgi:hypothetical protein
MSSVTAIVMWMGLGMLVFGMSGILAGAVWRHKGGPFSRGLYLGCTQPIVGILMAMWLSPEPDERTR